jgi:betaine-homocysteine S-methyltransferase
VSTNARPDLRQRLADGTMIIAEGYVFELERRGYIKAGPYVPEVVLDYPDAVKELHREFLLAGSDVMVALTYYAHRDKLKDVGRENDLEEMNRTAVRLAQEVAAEGNALVAGNICNTWMYDPSDPVNSGSHVRDMYTEQVGWAKDAGVDFVLSETNDFLGEAEIALEVCQEAGLDAVINFASVTTKTRDGFSYVDACKRLADKGAAVVGMNCSRGPGTLLPVMRELRQELSIPLAAVPVPYRTTDNIPTMQMLEFEGARAFPMSIEPHVVTRFEFADFAAQAHDIGIEMIGVCCGGAPYHVRAAAEAIGRKVPASRYSPALDLHPDLSTERAKA